MTRISIFERKRRTKMTYYPSTPASNALLLSSREDMPVSASIRAGWSFSERVASMPLIATVAPTPGDKSLESISPPEDEIARTVQDRHGQVE